MKVDTELSGWHVCPKLDEAVNGCYNFRRWYRSWFICRFRHRNTTTGVL